MIKKRVAKAAPKKNASAKAAVPSMQDTMDEMLRQLTSLMGGEDISAEDLKALRVSLTAPSPSDDLSDQEVDAKYEAQVIAFDAMEATSSATARKLAKRALRLDPDCVDALVVLNDLDARTQKERIEGLQKAVAAGKRSLGAKFFRENKGDFWMLIETRPTMRVMATLAGEMASVGMSLDAIAIYEEMLALNPNDNQGVRDPLLGLYLAVGDATGAKRLLKRYKGDSSACFAWARVIEHLLAGDHKSADAALQKAVLANRFVAPHLAGQKSLPKSLPEMYSLGSVEEAVLCQHWLGAAWAAHRGAFAWVVDRCAEMNTPPVPSKTALKKMKTLDAGVQ